MKYVKHENCHFYYHSIFLILVLLFLNFPSVFPQFVQNQERIYFISDIQSPTLAEKILKKTYRNEEARDSLFADILRQHPKNLFLLGDLTSKGPKEKAWRPLDTFLNSLNNINAQVYAIPGNHEYMNTSSRGMQMFKNRFSEQSLYGYFVTVDSIAIVMLNSNFKHLSKKEFSEQLTWYKSVMDSLDITPAIKAIIVCTHHAPYSNSKIVGSSEQTEDLVVPIFEKSKKSVLFLSGHSHNLEYFSDNFGKHFLVIGGGGGITQPLKPLKKRKYYDLINQDVKPIYFYLVIEKNGNCLKLFAKGFKKDFRFFESYIGIVTFN